MLWIQWQWLVLGSNVEVSELTAGGALKAK